MEAAHAAGEDAGEEEFVMLPGVGLEPEDVLTTEPNARWSGVANANSTTNALTNSTNAPLRVQGSRWIEHAHMRERYLAPFVVSPYAHGKEKRNTLGDLASYWYAVGRYADAVHALSVVLEDPSQRRHMLPEQTLLYLDIVSRCLVRMAQHARAIPHLEQLLRMREGVDSSLLLASCYQHTLRETDCVQLYQQAIKLCPVHTLSWTGLAQSLLFFAQHRRRTFANNGDNDDNALLIEQYECAAYLCLHRIEDILQSDSVGHVPNKHALSTAVHASVSRQVSEALADVLQRPPVRRGLACTSTSDVDTATTISRDSQWRQLYVERADWSIDECATHVSPLLASFVHTFVCSPLRTLMELEKQRAIESIDNEEAAGDDNDGDDGGVVQVEDDEVARARAASRRERPQQKKEGRGRRSTTSKKATAVEAVSTGTASSSVEVVDDNRFNALQL